MDTVANAEGVIEGVLEGVAVRVVVDVRLQAVPVFVHVGVKEVVEERLPVLEGVFVIVSDVVWDALEVELIVVVPERLAVRVSEAVTVGVPVLTLVGVGAELGVPEIVLDPDAVFVLLGVWVVDRVDVDVSVVDRVAVPDGAIVTVPVTVDVTLLEPDGVFVGDRVSVEEVVVVRDPVLLVV